ncbi:hypothetical protein [Streptomyces sp. NPDC017949]|uniref:hypothetical protein n=1 Tax=Streptomyces sp. NPDC017949 TaxID=3365020 RepID=UPI0037A9ED46
MLAIAFRLGLRHGAAFPRTGQYIYNVSGLWALDYGHPRDCLCFSPTDFFWPLIARSRAGRSWPSAWTPFRRRRPPSER